jgi:hypothetical protein
LPFNADFSNLVARCSRLSLLWSKYAANRQSKILQQEFGVSHAFLQTQ